MDARDVTVTSMDRAFERWVQGGAAGLRRHALPAILTLFLASVGLGLLLVIPTAYGPIHFDDERLYWDMALQMYQGGLSITASRYPPAYPAALLPAFWLSFPSGTYDVAKVLNVLYLSSAVVPFFLLVDRLAGRGDAWAASVVLLVSPVHVVMPRVMLSENVFYPLFLWSTALAALDLVPSRRWIQDVALGVALGMLFLARYMGLALLPAFLMVWWMRCLPEEAGIPRAAWLRAIRVLVPIVALVGSWLVWGLCQGGTLAHLLGFGIAASPAAEQLTLDRLAMWAALYAGYLGLMAAPYAGVLFPALVRWKHLGLSGAQKRWVTAVVLILASLLITCIRHSWRAGYNYPEPSKLQGRYLLYCLPLLLISAMVALRQGAAQKPGRLLRLGAVALCGVLIAGGVGLLFKGWPILDRPVTISMNSPDGDLVECLGGKVFMAIGMGVAAASAIALGRGRRAAVLALVLGLVILYGAGDRAIYLTQLLPWQNANIHMRSVGPLLRQEADRGGGLSAVRIRVPAGTPARKMREMSNSLWMREAIAAQWELDSQLPEDTRLLATMDSAVVVVRRIERDDGAGCQGTAYRFEGRTFCAELRPHETLSW